MKKSTKPDPIEKARDYARRVIREVYPQSQEVPKPTSKMYVFDAITVNDESCDIATIVIMYDESADEFALVNHARPTGIRSYDADRRMDIAELLQQVEFDITMLSKECGTQLETRTVWAAIATTTSKTMRNRLCELERATEHI